MSSSRKPSSDVLKRIRAESKRLAELDYRSNLTKNKSAFISRQSGRHYARLLKKYYEDAERHKAVLLSSNQRLSAGNAQLRRQIHNLRHDIQFHELSRKLDGNRRR